MPSHLSKNKTQSLAHLQRSYVDVYQSLPQSRHIGVLNAAQTLKNTPTSGGFPLLSTPKCHLIHEAFFDNLHKNSTHPKPVAVS